MAALAQKCAEYYARQNDIDHTCPYVEGFGENLAQTGYYQDPVRSAKTSFDLWYNEKKDYDYEDPASCDFFDIGHFTQVVWKETQQIGCGVAANTGTKNSFVACLYSPPGNYDNEYEINVLPPK